jgi:hypothetical protein
MFLISTENSATLKNPSEWGDNIKNFIATCLLKEAKERPRAQDLLHVRNETILEFFFFFLLFFTKTCIHPSISNHLSLVSRIVERFFNNF